MAAVKERLEGQGIETYVVDVPEGVSPNYPYAIIWSSTGREVAESLCDDTYLSDTVYVTNVGLTPEAVWAMVKRTRSALRDWAPTVAGWSPQPLKPTTAQNVQPDRDVTLPGVNRHPYFGVDSYPLISEPA